MGPAVVQKNLEEARSTYAVVTGFYHTGKGVYYEQFA